MKDCWETDQLAMLYFKTEFRVKCTQATYKCNLIHNFLSPLYISNNIPNEQKRQKIEI